jgi:hypothetical protein
MSRELMELIVYRQLASSGESWTHAVFLVGVFLIVLFRRDQIVAPYMFRVSVLLFVLSFILPVVVNGVMQYKARATGGIMIGSVGGFLQSMTTSIGPITLGFAVLLCVLSMLPQRSRYPGPPHGPAEPHPLD